MFSGRQIIERAALLNHIAASMAKRTKNDPNLAVEDDLCSHGPFRKDFSDSMAQIIRCKRVFSQAKTKKAAKRGLAASMADW
jgi:hypothetical protein